MIALDLLKYSSHDAIFAEVIKKYGKIDILVNNAGRSQVLLCYNNVLSVC